MPLNLSGLSQATTAATALSNLILVSPQEDLGIQPQTVVTQVQHPPKFLFNYYGDQEVLLEADITDHFVEDNTALQDQIALKPEMITGEGFIGELNDVVPDLLKPLKIAADKLSVISGYTPGLSTTAQLAYNTAFQLYQVALLGASAGVAAWNSLSGQAGQGVNIANAQFPSVQNQQQLAFQYFYGYFKSRVLFTVQTPFAVFQNCAIKSVRAIQSAESNTFSTFAVTFKPINFAKTVSVGIQNTGQGRFNAQAAAGSPTNLGDAAGTPISSGAQSTLLQGVF